MILHDIVYVRTHITLQDIVYLKTNNITSYCMCKDAHDII